MSNSDENMNFFTYVFFDILKLCQLFQVVIND
jgi:hypothetical protein